MKKSKSSARWQQAHQEDEYVKRARREGYRSRASYKLIEMDDKYGLIKPGMCVIDLGAAPGGWSQVAASRVGPGGRVIAMDVLAMEPLPGVDFIQGDLTGDEVLERVLEKAGKSGIDLVISDMAPNLSGIRDIDQPRATLLVELAVELADRALREGGSLVAKCFEGEGINEIRASFRQRFEKVVNVKPRASRGKSREIYLIGRGHINAPANNRDEYSSENRG